MPEQKFKYSMLIKSVKSIDGENYIEGYASTWNKDRDGDIIVPSAFDKTMDEYMTNPVILIDHVYRVENIIGKVVEFKIDEKGLWIKAMLIKPITDYAKQIIQNIIDGFLKTLSIGGYFERVQNVITSIRLYEISAVTIPANSECQFSMAKMLSDLKDEQPAEVKKPEEKAETKTGTKIKNKEDEKMTPEELKKSMEEMFAKQSKEAEEKAAKAEEAKKAAEEKKLADEKAAKEAEVKIAEQVTAKVNEALAGITKGSKIEFPTTMRVGNLAIEDKQLLDMVTGKGHTVTILDGKMVDFNFKGGKAILEKKGVAMDTSESGSGAEWIPTELAGTLIEQIRTDALVYGSFQEIKMPIPVYDNPILTADPTFILQGEATDDSTVKTTSSKPTTGKMTLTSKKLGAKVAFSEEQNEDSAVAMLPELKKNLITAGAETLDNIVINGDTAGSQDSDDAGATDQRRAWDGLRKYALAVAGLKIDLGTFNAANAVAWIGKLKKYAAKTSDLVIVSTPLKFWTSLFLLETSAGGKPLFVADTKAYGGLGYFCGIPVVLSDQQRDDVNASGVYDGSTTSKSTMLVYRRAAFRTGSRRIMTFRTYFDGDLDSNILYVTMRNAFTPVQTPSATVTSVAIGYNIG